MLRAGDGLADSVLDRTNNSFNSPDALVMLGEGNSELDGLLNFKLRPDITFISVLTRSLPAFTIFSPALIQMILGVPLRANVLLKPLEMLWAL